MIRAKVPVHQTASHRRAARRLGQAINEAPQLRDLTGRVSVPLEVAHEPARSAGDIPGIEGDYLRDRGS